MTGYCLFYKANNNYWYGLIKTDAMKIYRRAYFKILCLVSKWHRKDAGDVLRALRSFGVSHHNLADLCPANPRRDQINVRL